MSRRGPSEYYDERERDYRRGPRSVREYEDIDRRPDFLRDDYGRSSAGALVVRDPRPSFDYDRGAVRQKPRETVDKHELVIREREKYAPRRDDFALRRPDRAQTRDGVDFAIRHEERDRQSIRDGPDREELIFKHTDIDRPGWRDDVHKDELIYRREDRGGRPQEVARDAVVLRPRERSLPPPGALVAREREDFVVRRRDKPKQVEQEEIIIRRRERSPSSSPSPPPPPPEPEPVIVRPPIHQEIITHHRHIDHGFVRARSPTPPPPPPSPPKEELLEIEIRRKTGRDSPKFHEVVYERERERERRGREVAISRRRSLSAPRRRDYDYSVSAEAEYYHRRGSSRDWAIVDVPPGTKRMTMDGAGSEVTWQRYNGVRRSKFVVEGSDYDSSFGISGDRRISVPSRHDEMWTEITKDLVIKEAIEMAGYAFEETDYFFYVMDYLRYEDVLRLVELSDDIRRERRERILEIQYERDELNKRRERRPPYDERVFEREVVYEGKRPGRYR